MSAPEALLVLDCLARRYNTDPETVSTWTPYRLTIAWQCYLAANAAVASKVALSDGMVFPVIDIGGG